MSTDIADQLRVERSGPVAWLTLCNTAGRNSLSLGLLRHLGATVQEVAADERVGVIVLAGEGPAFSAGHDLKEMCDADQPYYDELFTTCSEVMLSLHAVPQPVIAAVDGVATAAGCQLVASCDLVVASTNATFATPGVSIGLFCSTPMVALSRSIGSKRALQMLLTGTPIDAQTAADWGLVNIVSDPADLRTAVTDLAQQIATASPHTIALGKRAFYEQLALSESDAYQLAQRVMAINAADAVAAEGIGAFLAKRPPVWPSSPIRNI